MNLFGMKVVVSPLLKPVPKIQLRPDFEWCTDEFRREFNQLLLNDYGTKDVAYLIAEKTLVLSPEAYGKMWIDLKPNLPTNHTDKP